MLLLGALALLISRHVLRAVHALYISPLRKIPGDKRPLYIPFFRWPAFIKGTRFSEFLADHKKYGSVMRTNVNVVSISDPNLVREVLLLSDFPKPPEYRLLLKPFEDNLFGTTDVAFHKKMRRTLSPAFSIKTLQTLEPLIQQTYAKLFKKLTKHGQGEVMENAWELMRAVSLDAIGEIAFGLEFGMIEACGNTSFDYAEKNQGQTLPKAIQNILKFNSRNMFFPFMSHIPFLPDTIQWKKDTAFVKKLMVQVIKSRRDATAAANQQQEKSSKTKGTRRDLLQLLIEAKDSETGDALSDEHILSHTVLFLFAGSDTTANTMAFTLMELCENPWALAKVQSELDSLPLDPSTNLISYSHLKTSAPYLDACIHESMRLHPVATFVPRVTPRDTVLGGHFLPKGTLVSCCQYATHRDPSVWKDPETFEPERWLGVLDRRDKEADDVLQPGVDAGTDVRGAFYPFSLGSRNCIGKNLAQMEMRIVLGNLLRHFHLRRPELMKQDLSMVTYLTLQLKSGKYWIVIRKRES
ncbi:hypothetical protein HK102_000796 [Quaeritorhiza haematococci]|nr:hypothetical protein HK102_000796 [Quaeritorhiza haematococci]